MHVIFANINLIIVVLCEFSRVNESEEFIFEINFVMSHYDEQQKFEKVTKPKLSTLYLAPGADRFATMSEPNPAAGGVLG